MGWKAGSRAVLRLMALMAFALNPLATSAQESEFELRWNTVEPVADADQAARNIIDLQNFMVLYNGMRVDKIVVSRDGLAIHARETTIETQSNYVPTYGGSWIGGTYVPYYGGSTVTSAVPVTSERQEFISFRDFAVPDLLYFPNRNYKWGIYFGSNQAGRNVVLRTSDEALARQFINAATYLIIASNLDKLGGLDTFGMWIVFEDKAAAKKAKWNRDGGLYVTKVAAGGPADKAGIKPGDIIFEANGQQLNRHHDLFAVLGMERATRTQFVLDLKAWRDKAEVPLRLEFANPQLAYFQATNPQALGLGIEAATPADISRLGLPASGGPIVRVVMAGSRGEKMNFRADDLLTEANGQQVTTPESVHAIAKAGRITQARVLRGGAIVELKHEDAQPAARPQRFGISLRETPGIGDGPARIEVVSIEPGSTASRLDFRVGDFVVEVNGKPVTRTSDLVAAVAAGPVTAAKVERAGKIVALAEIVSF